MSNKQGLQVSGEKGLPIVFKPVERSEQHRW